MEIAWIGTGIMGAPMARNLMRAGHRLRLYNRSAKKAVALQTRHTAIEKVFFMMLISVNLEKERDRAAPPLHCRMRRAFRNLIVRQTWMFAMRQTPVTISA